LPVVKEKKQDPDNTRDSAGYYCSVQLELVLRQGAMPNIRPWPAQTWVKFVPRQNFGASVITTLLIDETNFGWIYIIQHWYYKNPLLQGYEQCMYSTRRADRETGYLPARQQAQGSAVSAVSTGAGIWDSTTMISRSRPHIHEREHLLSTPLLPSLTLSLR
jgi:hypothetical protein